MKLTKATSKKQIERNWHLVDARKKILGRTASKIAKLLMGKFKPYFVLNLDCGDYVVVINASEVKVTGKKEENKVYTSYSGYPGGFSQKTYSQLKKDKPEEIIKKAVYGMLPKNKLRKKMMKRLRIYKGDNHPYKDKVSKTS